MNELQRCSVSLIISVPREKKKAKGNQDNKQTYTDLHSRLLDYNSLMDYSSSFNVDQYHSQAFPGSSKQGKPKQKENLYSYHISVVTRIPVCVLHYHWAHAHGIIMGLIVFQDSLLKNVLKAGC